MAKRQIEIDDTLQERVDSAIEDVKQELLNHLEENTPDGVPCLSNDLDYSGAIHEIVDGSVPIYTKEIDDTWYLYGSELEEAYENAGCGENPRENNGMAAIYYYVHEKVNEWYHNNAEDIFDEWKEPRDKAVDAGKQAGEDAAERHNSSEAGEFEDSINPYCAYTQAALRELWQDAYDEALEDGKE